MDRERQEAEILRVLSETQLGDSGITLTEKLNDQEVDDLFDALAGCLYKTPVKQVEEFHTVFEQPVAYKPNIPVKNRLRLRLNLIFEELREFAQAAGVELEFYLMVQEYVQEKIKTEVNWQMKPNIVEMLDALADLEYVVSGTILECGFTEFFYSAFTAVHDSNMSKLAPTEDDAIRTCNERRDRLGEACSYRFIPEAGYLITRDSDKKVIKSNTYEPVQLRFFFEEDELV